MEHCIDPHLLGLLRRGINSGLWTLENLDQPSPAWVNNTAVDRDHFPGGYTGITHRNLLRDDYHPEAVEASPDPRDFAESKPTLRRTEPQIFNTEPTDQGMGASAIFGDPDLLAHDEPSSQGCDREGQAELGEEGATDSSGTRKPLDW